jgi:uncharacterized membrane protein
MLVLLGVAIIVVGFALRLNPLAVVVAAAITTGVCAAIVAGHLSVGDVRDIIAELGKTFVANRFIAIAWLVLPVVGLLERGGIRERARTLVLRLRGATTGRVLTAYMLIRQVAAALGLTALGGHAQMVRPVVAPMAEAAAEVSGPLDPETRDMVRANAAAVDNIGMFFGEDVFVAIGSILLIKGFLEQNGIFVTPPQLALWAIPTAIMAFVIHATRLWLLDRRLARKARA